MYFWSTLGRVAKRQDQSGFSADGRRCLSSNSNSNKVSVMDSTSLQVIDSFPAGINPEGITVDRRNRMSVGNENESAATIIDVSKRDYQTSTKSAAKWRPVLSPA
jgi:YVTN family beta-propeller protein